MSVRLKFNEFKKELKEAYDRDSKNLLDMSGSSVDELVGRGYIHRKIDSFMFVKEFTEIETGKFFAEECMDLDCVTVGPVSECGPDEKICELISRIKLHSVKCKLWFELIDFLSRLKEESIDRN